MSRTPPTAPTSDPPLLRQLDSTQASDITRSAGRPFSWAKRMRIGRRYSRSAGTMSPAGPRYAATDSLGAERAVSPGAGLAWGAAGGGEPGAVAAATAGSGMPSTGTGPGGGAVGR